MAKGYPDFYGIPQFPGYYAAEYTETSFTLQNTGNQIIHIVEGKGIMYYAWLRSVDTDAKTYLSIKFAIDGNNCENTITNLLYRGGNVPRSPGLWRAIEHDIIGNDYEYELCGPIPFGESVAILGGASPNPLVVMGSMLCSMVVA